jgi:hypothetical protein
MNRIEFLRRFLGSGLLLTMPEMTKENEFSYIPIYDDFVAGFQYYKGMELKDSIAAGQSLDLVREPENKYDNQAIAIYWEGQKLGFMPQHNNLIPSALLDAKIPCIATVKAVYKNTVPWETLEFSISLAYPKAFLV